MNDLIFSLNATVPIFLLMVIGYFLKRIKLINDDFLKVVNNLNFKFTLPILLFLDISTSDFTSVWDPAYVLFCFIITLICFILIFIFSVFFVKDKSQLGEFVQASYRGSAAVLGIAFLQNIYGSSGMAPMMILGTVPLYNILAVILLSFTVKHQKNDIRQIIKETCFGIITNPIILAILCGILVSIMKIDFPFIIDKTLSSIAATATPLALISLGGGFYFKEAFGKVKLTIVSTIIKLILQPLLFLPVAIMLGYRGTTLAALLIMLGAPTTVSCYVMAKNMNHEGILTSNAVVSSTFFSSFSITFWLFLLRSYHLI